LFDARAFAEIFSGAANFANPGVVAEEAARMGRRTSGRFIASDDSYLFF
jgi:hypothetical protein